MIKKDEVLKIAKLAKLSVDENEIEQLIDDMSRIIEYADSINNAIETVDVEIDNINKIENAFNEDIVLDSFDRDEILKNREGGENGYFAIRKSLRGRKV